MIKAVIIKEDHAEVSIAFQVPMSSIRAWFGERSTQWSDEDCFKQAKSIIKKCLEENLALATYNLSVEVK